MIKRVQAGRLSLIMLLACLLVSVGSFGQTNVVPDDVELAALKDLYTSLNGDSWTRRTNWPTVATWPTTATSAVMDSWAGIVVRNGDISEISIVRANLTGSLPSTLVNLMQLKVLTLEDNNISGPLPSWLNEMTGLTELSLGSNDFTGAFPDLSSLQELTMLSLGSIPTLTAGPIPGWITSLHNLAILDIRNTARTGSIPTTIAAVNFPKLTHLTLPGNDLSGAIPAELGTLPKLLYLNLYDNELTGEIPASLGNLSLLQTLHLYNNKLTGPIPPALGDLSELTSLDLSGNQLTESIPVSLGSFTKLKLLNLELNQLSGPIPSTIGNLSTVTTMMLDHNKLSGEIPATFSGLRELVNLHLHANQFSGPLPSLSSLSKVKTIYAQMNYFTGGIPGSYAGFPELLELTVQNNQLSGEIPASLFTSNWSKLTDLNLSDNYFTGAFPSSIGNCTSLATFRVMNNKFTSIPQALLTSTRLSALNFSNNALTSIPNFADYANNSKLSMVVSLNYLGYDMLEPLVNPTTGAIITKSLTYRPQKIFDQVRRVDVPLGNTLELPAASKGTYGTVIWEKKTANGTWANINSTNTDNSQQTYRLPNVTAAAEGIYRWTATNTKLTSATLQSVEINVRVVEAVKQAGDRGIALYNGLISAARWRTTKARGATGDDLTGMYVYQYDDKYQIKDASWAEANNTLNTYTWSGNRFRLTGMEYDANGNIQKLNRYNDQAEQQHNFQYHYKNNTNRLTSIDGYAQSYDYDEIGRTTKIDKTESEDQYVDYDVTGKVIAVYSTVDKRPEDKKVEYLYDDRGFRMAKVNYALNRTTWYIRDASGNVLNVYDQEGKQDSTNNNPVTKTEMPVYAAGKIGTYYPAQDGSLEYELTDHLGNVRALVREDVKTYTATMEDTGDASIDNPRLEEGQYFQNIVETEQVDVHMNHTQETSDVPNPSRSAYLYWNDTPGTLMTQKSTGPAIALEVQHGDTVRAEAYVRFEEKMSYSHNGITLSVLSAMLGNTFAFAGGVDGATAGQTTEWFNSALSAGGFLNYTEDGRPNAYLSYIIFDANMVRVASGRQPVPVDAGFVAGEEATGTHERVYFPQPVIVPSGGQYIYVWVSNESPETRVWFDDVSVTHTTSYVSQATDYGVWGDVLRTVSTEPAPAALLRTNLKGQYAFSGDAQDQSGNGLNGTVIGAVLRTGVDGEANNAYSFNGVNSYVKLEGSADKLSFVQNTGVFTIAAYIKLNDLNARSAIVSSITSTNQKGFAFVFDTFGGDYGTHALRFSSTRGDGSSLNLGAGTNYAINDTEWHHVAVVGDGSTFRFYIDGEPDGYATAFNSFSSGTSVGDILIGASRTTATNIQLPMNGAIDEVHIFDKALSGSEIRLLAEGASPEQIDQVLQPVNRGYRYKYQGQFAERDEETGWDHFELREYDAVIGRWTSTDPYGQYWSPYMSMGNSPINLADVDGGSAAPPDWYLNEQTNKVEWHDNNPGDGYKWVGNEDFTFDGATLPEFQITDLEYLQREYGAYGVWFTKENSSYYNPYILTQEELETSAKIQLAAVGAVAGVGALIELAPSAMTLANGLYLDAGAAYNAINVIVSQGARNLALRVATAARPTLLAPAFGTKAWKVGSKIYIDLIHFSRKGRVDVYKLGNKLYKMYDKASDVVEGLTEPD